MLRSRLCWWLVACAGWLWWGYPAAQVRAQAEPQPTQASTNTYDSFIEQALQSYEGGRFAEARTLFRRAHELSPTARTLRTIGMCSFNLGDYVDAVANLETALTDQRKGLTDEQRRHVTDLIARSNQRVGRFRLRVTPAESIITVDGRAPTMINQRELILEVGRHEIELQASGYRTAQSALQVEGGDRTSLELRLSPASDERVAQVTSSSPQPLAAPTPSQVARAQTGSASRAGSTQATLGWTSIGVGAAGLIAFGIVSALAISKEQDLSDRCPQAQCRPAQHSELDSYDALKAASTASLIGGAAFIALGAGLLIFDSPSKPERAGLEPLLGPGAIGLRGRL